jgi:hypothetical protein
MAQLKNLLVNGPSKFIGPVAGATFSKPIYFPGESALPKKADLQFVLGIDSFANGGQAGWKEVNQLIVKEAGYAATAGTASTASSVAWGNVSGKPDKFEPVTHTHDYSPSGHNHDATYSKANHNHDSSYSPLGHTHDYASSGHNHDTIYSKLGHTHDYAASGHNHDTIYSKLGHNHTEYAVTGHSHTDYNPVLTSVSGTAPLTLTLSADKKTITGSISTGTTDKVGVVKQHTANDCTSYTSDEGATTPAAVKKAVELFGDQWYSPLGHSHDAVTYATYLALQTTSNLAGQTNKLSTRASSWGGQAPNTVKSIPWRQAWVDSSISSDSGDMVLGLRPSEYSPGGTELCMFIDGDYYAMGNKVLNTANYSTYLDNRYVTLDTTQTIGGAKTFTSATTTIHHKLQLTRSSSVTEGRLSFYDAGYNTWIEYMSNPAAGCCPTKGTPSTLGDVTSWARRSIIENSTGYGWIWEACANGYEGTPNPIMALSSNTGQMTLAGTTVALNSGSGKIQYNTTTKSIDFIFA